MDNKSEAVGGHAEDLEREDGKWMRTEGNKRKTIEEEEESMLRPTAKCLRRWREQRTRMNLRKHRRQWNWQRWK